MGDCKRSNLHGTFQQKIDGKYLSRLLDSELDISGNKFYEENESSHLST